MKQLLNQSKPLFIIYYNMRIFVNLEIITSAVVQISAVDAIDFALIYCVVPRFIQLRLCLNLHSLLIEYFVNYFKIKFPNDDCLLLGLILVTLLL